jgi:hypothetical protein
MWAETALTGAFYVAAMVFLILRLAGVYDFAWLISARDFSAAAGIVAVGLSYVAGRLAAVLQDPLLRLVRITSANAGAISDQDHIRIWQHGSQRLHWGIDTTFYISELSKSLSVATLTFAVCFALWLYEALSPFAALAMIAFGVMCFVCFVRAFLQQQALLEQYLRAAIVEIDLEVAHSRMKD